jgi:hypothetical protein
LATNGMTERDCAYRYYPDGNDRRVLICFARVKHAMAFKLASDPGALGWGYMDSWSCKRRFLTIGWNGSSLL